MAKKKKIYSEEQLIDFVNYVLDFRSKHGVSVGVSTTVSDAELTNWKEKEAKK